MSHLAPVSEGTEFDGLPRRLPDQNAILIGRAGGDSEFGGLAVFYIN